MTPEELIEAAHETGACKCENWDGGGWTVTHMEITPEQLTAFAAAIIAADRAQRQAEPESRHVLQADGKHPAPCAKFCEATAFKHEINRLKREAAHRPAQVPLTDEVVGHCINRHVEADLYHQPRYLARIVEEQCALAWGVQLDGIAQAVQPADVSLIDEGKRP